MARQALGTPATDSPEGLPRDLSQQHTCIFDVLVDGVAHESKVGYVPLGKFTEDQVSKDAWLVGNGGIDGAHWHFFASARPNTIGPSPRLLDLLAEEGIPYTLHLPTKL